MKIAIIGIGGVGGYFGGKLAKTSHHVTFVVRGDNLQAIRERGLQVRSIYGDFIVRPDKVTDAVSDLDTPDLVLLAVKSWQVAEIASTLKPFLAEHSLVLPLQNGADNVEKLLEVLPAKNVLSGLCKIISYVEGPGPDPPSSVSSTSNLWVSR